MCWGVQKEVEVNEASLVAISEEKKKKEKRKKEKREKQKRKRKHE